MLKKGKKLLGTKTVKTTYIGIMGDGCARLACLTTDSLQRRNEICSIIKIHYLS